MTIYSTSVDKRKEFVPTWLMIKQHNKTGLKYFCKTTRKNPIKYNGSGKFWQRHLNVHGKDVTTIWYQLFTDKEDLIEFALFFSDFHDIVDSRDFDGNKLWANLKPEDGLWGGGVKGISIKRTDAHNQKISEGVNRYRVENGLTAAPKKEKRESGWKWDEKSRSNQSKIQNVLAKRKMCCLHCREECSVLNSHHGNNCKLNPVYHK